MTVLNYEKYKLSDHAFERIQARFNIPRGEAYGWLRRLLENAEFVKVDKQGCELYKLKEIRIVVNPITHFVVTVYQADTLQDQYYREMTELMMSALGIKDKEAEALKKKTWKFFLERQSGKEKLNE
ncbi:MAG: hypothetical protein ABF575_00360 [Liquorilactobacillus hordei]|uniref:hypothetical protein n=1 Tax=Liquorilactobacillus hordei TaxID=468911 RepID=UPI0039EC300E